MKIICLFATLFICSLNNQTVAQTPVPEDLFDLYDNEEDDDVEDDNGSDFNQDIDKVDPFKMPNDSELKELYMGLNKSGALGAIPIDAFQSYLLVNEDCDGAYICMFNMLKKTLTVAFYEGTLKRELSCKERKGVLEEYLIFLQSINLDIYCVDKLYPENNNLSDEELINAVLAMGDFYRFVSINYAHTQTPNLPMIEPYEHARKIADSFCTGYLYDESIIDNIMDPLEEFDCDCGTYEGTFDYFEMEDVHEDIKRIIDDLNPTWQIQKTLEINQNLKALPCND